MKRNWSIENVYPVAKAEAVSNGYRLSISVYNGRVDAHAYAPDGRHHRLFIHKPAGSIYDFVDDVMDQLARSIRKV